MAIIERESLVYLAHISLKQDPSIEVTIFEASNRVGGKIQTYRSDGYTIELGPESYLGRKTIMTDVAKILD